MPTPRLSLGYSPRYWRFSRLCERPQSLSYRTLLHRHRARLRTLPFQLVPSRSQTTIPQRHGTAVEHIPQPPPGRTPPPKPSQNAAKQPKEEDDGASEARTKEPPKPAIGGSSNSNVSAIEVAGNDAKTKPESVGRKPDDPSAPSADPSDPSTVASPAPSSDEATDSAPRPFSDSMALQTVASSRPLETVLHMEPPTTSQDEARYRTPPHLEPAPYVHHFDTYTLVKDLSKGGFTDDQSVTIMKAVRSLLAVNLDIAKEGLVSKSDVENVRFCPLHTTGNDLCASVESFLLTALPRRNPTFFALLAPSSAPRSRRAAKQPPKRCAASARTCSTRWTSWASG